MMLTTIQADRTEPVIDLQAIPPFQRHPLVFQAVQGLAAGEGFLLVNDHDPRPLHHQLLAHFGAGLTWDYREQGPRVWQVRIGRATEADTPFTLRVRIDRNGDATVADDGAVLGPDGTGASVCDVTGCPPGTMRTDVLSLLQDVIPPVGVVGIPFDRLLARRNGSCCGGMCG
ncbi:DUF2249 domain-containing protein [Azospirillum picis]|uniref:Uncharacterized protein (DUF2249 family) n=1 Tax=Azospirillum picis TaxID=488438 RepID=A0ABU0MN31_9PROT|nr:DUF2249 domain-containing protein [Azospirillum picis]MBP2301157.1 uncharacterized protein (DUF2249 family) [Azospirillum picis]MDQ0534881.1 uncharacterized protein (DUF2249 family) [Azospirillum picis]